MGLDNYKNFAKVTVSTGYDAAATSIALSSGNGALLPAVGASGGFNITWWNSTDYNDPSDDPNVEVVRCTAKSTDTLTVTRAQESTSASTKNTVGKTYKMVAAWTAKVATDIAAIKLDELSAPTDVTTLNVSSTAHGLTPKSPADSTKFLNGAATPAWSSMPWTMLSKSADQTINNSAALTNDDTMAFSMASSTKYRIRGIVFFDTTAAADFKYDFTAPASPTLVRGTRSHAAAGAAIAEVATDVANPSSPVSLTGNGTTGGCVKFDFVWHNNTNAATFAFRWAQNTQTNDTGAIVRAGSYMEYAVI